MEKKGSVTVYLALLMSLMLALLSSCLASAQQAAARVQIACSADAGLYSLLAGYDKTLLEEYDLFYLDGGFGSDTLKLAEVYDIAVAYMKPVLKENYQKLELTGGGITGYHLATDGGGASFRNQVADYMRDTLGIQGAEALIQKVQQRGEESRQQQQQQEAAQQGNTLEDYDRAIEEAAQEENNQEEDAQPGGEEGDIVEEEPPIEPEPVENPIDIIREIQKMGILELVVPNPSEVSQKTVDVGTLVSHRSLETGMGELYTEPAGDSVADKILFQEYLLTHTGNYSKPSSGQLAYSMEYVIGKKGSDVENLKSVVNRLLLVREGVNFAALLADGSLHAQATALATAIAASLMIPVAESLVEIVLIGCWAFGESVLDVRELLSGGKVAYVKNQTNWQLSLENLGQLLERRDADRKTVDNGMSYEDYLRILLYLESSDEQTWKLMDVFEMAVRSMDGKEQFRMDHCIDAVEMEFDVKANGRKTYQVRRNYSYV